MRMPWTRRPGRAPLPEHVALRRRMHMFSAPVVLLALLAASLLLGVVAGNALAADAQEDGRHTTAAERYDRLKPFTRVVVEPWKAWFNTGTAELGAGETFRAVENLRRAHELVPPGTTDHEGNPDPRTPECRVRTNLSLALEAMGDEALESADPGMAVSYYTEAMDVLGPCTSDGESAAEEEPTEQPTEEPTEQPTAEPTEQPTAEPTEQPTAEPTEQPTAEPTEQPSDEPTTEPSDQPSEQPSGQPSEQPSGEPTSDPSGRPYGEPTPDPSGDPTSGAGGGDDQQRPSTPDENEQRQKDKADKAREQRDRGPRDGPGQAPGGPGADDPSGEQGGGPTESPSGGGEERTAEPQDPMQRELEERNRDAERDRREQEQREGGGFGGGQNW